MNNFNDLTNLADILLAPDGCPWDKEQTIQSLKKYIIEEVEEVKQAIEAMDWDNLKEELGDVLYNIIFISKVAEKNKKFTIDDVIEGIHEKLIRRHPHIFGDEKAKSMTSEDVKKAWNEIKKMEKHGSKKK